MPRNENEIGIDFGASFCTMSCYDPESKQAKTLTNREGEERTPSVVYYGASGASAGKVALSEFAGAAARDARDASARLIPSIKRNLVSDSGIPLPGGNTVQPQEVVSRILAKLKLDAEEGHFHEKVERATIVLPPAFDEDQRRVIKEGAGLAGFVSVDILQYSAAIAKALAAEGQKLPDKLLVYDLGGGTLNLAVLSRKADGTYSVTLSPGGDAACGGDDFDRAIYSALGGGATLDAAFLLDCRRAKEELSNSAKAEVRNPAGGGELPITKEFFEGLIRMFISRTMRKASAMLAEAKAVGCAVESVVLLGGSSRVPLVSQELEAILGRSGGKTTLLKYADQAAIPALGAAYAIAPRLSAARPVAKPVPAPQPRPAEPLTPQPQPNEPAMPQPIGFGPTGTPSTPLQPVGFGPGTPSSTPPQPVGFGPGGTPPSYPLPNVPDWRSPGSVPPGPAGRGDRSIILVHCRPKISLGDTINKVDFMNRVLIRVDQTERPAGWGEETFYVAPGTHRVEVCLKSLFGTNKPSSITVEIGAGETKSVEYVSGLTVFGEGTIELQNRMAYPAAPPAGTPPPPTTPPPPPQGGVPPVTADPGLKQCPKCGYRQSIGRFCALCGTGLGA